VGGKIGKNASGKEGKKRRFQRRNYERRKASSGARVTALDKQKRALPQRNGGGAKGLQQRRGTGLTELSPLGEEPLKQVAGRVEKCSTLA